MLKDCSPIDIKKFAKTYKNDFGNGKKARESATDWLQTLSKHSLDSAQLFNFFDSNNEPEPVVYADRSGQWWTGRYIGSLTFNDISIDIHPRFGMEFVADSIPLNNFIPLEVAKNLKTGEKFIHFLQAFIWLNLLTKAARHTLPTVRTQKEYSSSISKGRIDIRRTLKAWTKDKSNIVSVSSHKEINNPITTVIVLAFTEIQSWFPNHDLHNWLPNTISLRLQQMINCTPRHSRVPKPKDIKKCKLGSLGRTYAPLSRLSLDILKNKGISEIDSDKNRKTFLLDVAELWEVYILNALRDASPDSFEVTHGTYESHEYLLESSTTNQHIGKLLPDYILNDDGKLISVADAKCKKLGDAPWMSPKRDDLYQMTAYLSHFECESGYFYYPDWRENQEEVSNITSNNPWLLKSNEKPTQKMNFISVPINKKEAIEKLKEVHGF